jgi:hypothetical protein
VLHDTKVRKAWLVDGVSALLHLVRANLSDNSREDEYGIASLAKTRGFATKSAYIGKEFGIPDLSG